MPPPFARLLTDLDRALGSPERLDVIDIGAGSAALLSRIGAHVPAELAVRLRPAAVEVAERPPGLPRRSPGWRSRHRRSRGW